MRDQPRRNRLFRSASAASADSVADTIVFKYIEKTCRFYNLNYLYIQNRIHELQKHKGEPGKTLDYKQNDQDLGEGGDVQRIACARILSFMKSVYIVSPNSNGVANDVMMQSPFMKPEPSIIYDTEHRQFKNNVDEPFYACIIHKHTQQVDGQRGPRVSSYLHSFLPTEDELFIEAETQILLLSSVTPEVDRSEFVVNDSLCRFVFQEDGSTSTPINEVSNWPQYVLRDVNGDTSQKPLLVWKRFKGTPWALKDTLGLKHWAKIPKNANRTLPAAFDCGYNHHHDDTAYAKALNTEFTNLFNTNKNQHTIYDIAMKRHPDFEFQLELYQGRNTLDTTLMRIIINERTDGRPMIQFAWFQNWGIDKYLTFPEQHYICVYLHRHKELKSPHVYFNVNLTAVQLHIPQWGVSDLNDIIIHHRDATPIPDPVLNLNTMNTIFDAEENDLGILKQHVYRIELEQENKHKKERVNEKEILCAILGRASSSNSRPFTYMSPEEGERRRQKKEKELIEKEEEEEARKRRAEEKAREEEEARKRRAEEKAREEEEARKRRAEEKAREEEEAQYRTMNEEARNLERARNLEELERLAKATNRTVLSKEEKRDLISFLDRPGTTEQKLNTLSDRFTKELDGVILERDQLKKRIEELNANHNRTMQRKSAQCEKEMNMKHTRINELTAQISKLTQTINYWKEETLKATKSRDDVTKKYGTCVTEQKDVKEENRKIKEQLILLQDELKAQDVRMLRKPRTHDEVHTFLTERLDKDEGGTLNTTSFYFDERTYFLKVNPKLYELLKDFKHRVPARELLLRVAPESFLRTLFFKNS